MLTALALLASLAGADCRGVRVQLSGFRGVRVQVVGAFEDLKVQVVTRRPARCGEWQFVNVNPDVRIMLVHTRPDLKIRMVPAFPGRVRR